METTGCRLGYEGVRRLRWWRGWWSYQTWCDWITEGGNVFLVARQDGFYGRRWVSLMVLSDQIRSMHEGIPIHFHFWGNPSIWWDIGVTSSYWNTNEPECVRFLVLPLHQSNLVVGERSSVRVPLFHDKATIGRSEMCCESTRYSVTLVGTPLEIRLFEPWRDHIISDWVWMLGMVDGDLLPLAILGLLFGIGLDSFQISGYIIEGLYHFYPSLKHSLDLIFSGLIGGFYFCFRG